ncbi:MAG TPA: nuclear transport factor 2 family protein, partial [Candidatus Acidoferrum sp.]
SPRAIVAQSMLNNVGMRSGRNIKRAAVCYFLVTLCAFAQSSQEVSSADAGKLVALERMWNQAQVVRDSAAIASMIGDKFTNTEWDGEVSDRGKFLADFADPKFQPSIMSIQDVKVEMYSTTAVVTGTYHTKGTYGAKPYEHFGRFTDTWIFQDGKWQCVASHTSLIKK